MLKQFENLLEFQKAFSTELKCAKYIAHLRWNDSPVCQHCGSIHKIYKLKSPALYECGVCNRQFSVRKNTIFEESALPFVKWFLAFYLMINNKKGISAHQLARDIGTTVKTAWFVQQRIRYALAHNTIEKMKGDIEVDETYVGGKEGNKHTNKKLEYSQGGNTKMAVVGIIQRGGRVALEYIGKSTIRSIRPMVERHVDLDNTQLFTDTSALYKGYKTRKAVNHSEGLYVNGDAYTNTIEGVFAHFKRMIHGIHHQVSKKHIQKYVDMFAFKYNRREDTAQSRFDDAMAMMFGKRLEYKNLIA